MPSYKHLFFDLDHTLWDFDTNAKEALTDLFQQHGLQEKVNAPFNDFYKNSIMIAFFKYQELCFH